jgi:hypothetical protein
MLTPFKRRATPFPEAVDTLQIDFEDNPDLESLPSGKDDDDDDDDDDDHDEKSVRSKNSSLKSESPVGSGNPDKRFRWYPKHAETILNSLFRYSTLTLIGDKELCTVSIDPEIRCITITGCEAASFETICRKLGNIEHYSVSNTIYNQIRS